MNLIAAEHIRPVRASGRDAIRPRRWTSSPDVASLERVLPRYRRRSAPVHLVWPSRWFEPAAVTLFWDALADAPPRIIGGRR